MKASTVSSVQKKSMNFPSFLVSRPTGPKLNSLHYPSSFIHGFPAELSASTKHSGHHTMKSFNDTTSTTVAHKLSTIVPTSTRASERKYIPLIAVKPPLSARHYTEDSKNQVKTFPLHSTKADAKRLPEKKDIRLSITEQDSTTPKAKLSEITSLSTRAFSSYTEDKLEPLQPGSSLSIQHAEPTRCSIKKNGILSAYAALTNQGLVRNYNEDRVSIILNIVKPQQRMNENWPKCSFFGVYDGHGGSFSADFLRDNLHQFVMKEPCFPTNPTQALLLGFANAEKKILEIQAQKNKDGLKDKSGSCAVAVLIVGDTCYVANVGDSRAILAADNGTKVYVLTKDHKPSEENEQKRIIEAGGQIYQYFQNRVIANRTSVPCSSGSKESIVGPKRVLPGRLSVSRTFGDPEAKISSLGGKPGVISSVPEIRSFKITANHDYIVLASDGIFDKLSNKDVVRCVTTTVSETAGGNKTAHEVCGKAVECIAKNALMRKSLDNVTVVMLAFKHFKTLVKHKNTVDRVNRSEIISQTKMERKYNGFSQEAIPRKADQGSDKKMTESRNVELSAKRITRTEMLSSGSDLINPRLLINGKVKASFK